MMSRCWFSANDVSGTESVFSLELVLRTGRGEQELSMLSKAEPPTMPAHPRQVVFMNSRRSMFLEAVANPQVDELVSGVERDIAGVRIGDVE